jgi:hypothetical protein
MLDQLVLIFALTIRLIKQQKTFHQVILEKTHARNKEVKKAHASDVDANAVTENAISQDYAGFPNYRLIFRDSNNIQSSGFIVGTNPFAGGVTKIDSILVPIVTKFTPPNSPPFIWHSNTGVENIRKSPIYYEAKFPNGKGQYLNQLARANFPKAVKDYQILFNQPKINNEISWEIPTDNGDVYTADGRDFGWIQGDTNDQLEFIFNFFFGYMEQEISAGRANAGKMFIFVTNNVFISDAAGFHSAYMANNGQMYYWMWTSFFHPSEYPDFPNFYPDTYTLAHEVAEWAFDYDVSTTVPDWICPEYPGSDTGFGCANNPFLENGDVLNCGNGPIPPGRKYHVNGYGYSLQTVALWQWFTGKSDIRGQNGQYSFPEPVLNAPAAFCT